MGIYGYNDFRAYSISHAQNDLEVAQIEHSYNDYRDYLSHNWGTSPKMKEAEKKYNAKYYQEHREEILKKRKEEKSRNSYKVNEEGWDYTKHDGAKRAWDSEKYGTDEKKKAELMRLANVNAFTDGLTEFDVFNDAANSLKDNKDYPPEVLKNIEENNANVRKNIENLMKTVEEYVKANGDKLSSDEIAKLYKDMDQQVELETKRVIDIGTKEGRAYVDDLLKEGGSGSSSSSGPSSKSTSSKTGSTSTSTTTNKDRTPKGSEATKSVSVDQQRDEQQSSRSNSKSTDNFNYDNDEARQRREAQQLQQEVNKKNASKKEEPLWKQMSPNAYIETRDNGDVAGAYQYTREEADADYQYNQGRDNSARDSNLKRQEQLIEKNRDKTFRSMDSYKKDYEKAVAEARTKRNAKK